MNAVISTGMATFEMVEKIYNLFYQERIDNQNFCILQCTSSYPTDAKGNK